MPIVRKRPLRSDWYTDIRTNCHAYESPLLEFVDSLLLEESRHCC
jgi:hypothetical protein